MAKNIVIGVGNLLFCDDGIGVLASEYLNKNYSFEPPLEIIDGGTLGIGLLNYFCEYDNVIIMDTISTEDKVGSIYELPSKELLSIEGYKNTAHEVEVIDMLKTASMAENCATVTIYAIVPSDIQSISIGLSGELEKYFTTYIETIIGGINKHFGNKAKKVTE